MVPNAINSPPINGKILISLNIFLSKEAIKFLSFIDETIIAAVRIAKLGNNGSI